MSGAAGTHTAADDVEALLSTPDALPPATRVVVDVTPQPRPTPAVAPAPPTVLPTPTMAGRKGGGDGGGVGASPEKPAEPIKLSGVAVTRLVVTFHPHPHLWIGRPVSFEVKVGMAYPATPPVVRCTDEAFVLEFGDRASLDSAGKPLLRLLTTEKMAWNPMFTLGDVVQCVRQCLLRIGVPLITAAPAPPATITVSGVAAALAAASGGSFSFGTAPSHAPMSTRGRAGSGLAAAHGFGSSTSPLGSAGISTRSWTGEAGGDGSVITGRSRRGSVTSSTAEGIAPLRSPSTANRSVGRNSALGSSLVAALTTAGTNTVSKSPSASQRMPASFYTLPAGAGVAASSPPSSLRGRSRSPSGTATATAARVWQASGSPSSATTDPSATFAGAAGGTATAADGEAAPPPVIATAHSFRRGSGGVADGLLSAAAAGAAVADSSSGSSGDATAAASSGVSGVTSESVTGLAESASLHELLAQPLVVPAAAGDAVGAMPEPSSAPLLTVATTLRSSSSSALGSSASASKLRAASLRLTEGAVGNGVGPLLSSSASAAALHHATATMRTPRGASLPMGPLLALVSGHHALLGRRPTMEDAAVWNDRLTLRMAAAATLLAAGAATGVVGGGGDEMPSAPASTADAAAPLTLSRDISRSGLSPSPQLTARDSRADSGSGLVPSLTLAGAQLRTGGSKASSRSTGPTGGGGRDSARSHVSGTGSQTSSAAPTPAPDGSGSGGSGSGASPTHDGRSSEAGGEAVGDGAGRLVSPSTGALADGGPVSPTSAAAGIAAMPIAMQPARSGRVRSQSPLQRAHSGIASNSGRRSSRDSGVGMPAGLPPVPVSARSGSSSALDGAAFPIASAPAPAAVDIGFYGVYDGHGGTRASAFVAQRLHLLVAERLATGQTASEALYHSFQQMDADFEAALLAFQQAAASREAAAEAPVIEARPASAQASGGAAARKPSGAAEEGVTSGTFALGSPLLSAVTPDIHATTRSSLASPAPRRSSTSAAGSIASDAASLTSIVSDTTHMSIASGGGAASAAGAGSGSGLGGVSNPFDIPGMGFDGVGSHGLGDFDNPETVDEQCGCTALAAVVAGNAANGGVVTVANAGDSRAILCRGGVAVALSSDHKASRPDERARIMVAGGFVIKNRVLGRLAVSRAIGDVTLKRGFTAGKLLVTGEPEVYEATLQPSDELLLMACDGVFDVMSSQAAVDIVREALAEGATAEEAASRLTAAAYASGSSDNLTAVVVRIEGGPPPEVAAAMKAKREAEAAAAKAAAEAAAAAKAAASATSTASLQALLASGTGAPRYGGGGAGGAAATVGTGADAATAAAAAAPAEAPTPAPAITLVTKKPKGENPFSRDARRKQGAAVIEKGVTLAQGEGGGAAAPAADAAHAPAPADATHAPAPAPSADAAHAPVPAPAHVAHGQAPATAAVAAQAPAPAVDSALEAATHAQAPAAAAGVVHAQATADAAPTPAPASTTAAGTAHVAAPAPAAASTAAHTTAPATAASPGATVPSRRPSADGPGAHAAGRRSRSRSRSPVPAPASDGAGDGGSHHRTRSERSRSPIATAAASSGGHRDGAAATAARDHGSVGSGGSSSGSVPHRATGRGATTTASAPARQGAAGAGTAAAAAGSGRSSGGGVGGASAAGTGSRRPAGSAAGPAATAHAPAPAPAPHGRSGVTHSAPSVVGGRGSSGSGSGHRVTTSATAMLTAVAANAAASSHHLTVGPAARGGAVTAARGAAASAGRGGAAPARRGGGSGHAAAPAPAASGSGRGGARSAAAAAPAPAPAPRDAAVSSTHSSERIGSDSLGSGSHLSLKSVATADALGEGAATVLASNGSAAAVDATDGSYMSLLSLGVSSGRVGEASPGDKLLTSVGARHSAGASGHGDALTALVSDVDAGMALGTPRLATPGSGRPASRGGATAAAAPSTGGGDSATGGMRSPAAFATVGAIIVSGGSGGGGGAASGSEEVATGGGAQ